MNPPSIPVGAAAPRPLAPRTESDVTSGWSADRHDEAPLVSIVCPTYQHVAFIDAALRGFLGQDTDFRFEIIVRDDGSTDGTADVVRDYAERFPTILRAILEPENRYPEVRPGDVLRPMIRGRFVARCEGDDYWFDPRHLQKRVDVLREDARTTAVVGDTVIVRDGRVVGHEWIQRDGRWNWYLPIRSLVTRADIDAGPYRWARDMGLALAIQRRGGLRVLDGPPTVAYRQHPGGIFAGRAFDEGYSGKENQPDLIRTWSGLALQLAKEGDLRLAADYHEHAMRKLSLLLAGFDVPAREGGSGTQQSRRSSAVDHLRRLALSARELVGRWRPR